MSLYRTAALFVSAFVLLSASVSAWDKKPEKAGQGGALPKGSRLRVRTPDAAEYLAYSPDGRMLAASGSRCPVILWDVATGKELHRFSSKSKSLWNSPPYFYPVVSPLAFSPDGKRLAFGDGQALVVVATGMGKERLRLATGQDTEAVAFAPDGASLAVAGMVEASAEDFKRAREKRAYYVPPAKRPEIQVWDLATGKKRSGTVGKSGERLVGLAFTPKKVVALLEDRGRIFELHTGKTVVERPEHGFDAIALSPDGSLLGFAIRYESITKVIDVASGKCRFQGANRPTAGLRFSPDNRHLAEIVWGGNGGRTVDEWDVSTGRKVKRLPEMPAPSPVTYGPGGRTLATGHTDSTVLTWSVKAP